MSLRAVAGEGVVLHVGEERDQGVGCSTCAGPAELHLQERSQHGEHAAPSFGSSTSVKDTDT